MSQERQRDGEAGEGTDQRKAARQTRIAVIAGGEDDQAGENRHPDREAENGGGLHGYLPSPGMPNQVSAVSENSTATIMAMA